METTLKDLLENTALGDELKATLQEAFENKIRSMETRLHEDYAARYQNDKAVLVEAMDRMLNDTIRSELGEFAEDRAKLRTATKTSSQRYNARLREHMKAINAFVARQLNEELTEFVKDRRQLKVQRHQMAKELENIRENTSLEYSQRVRKLEEFILKQLSEEIAELKKLALNSLIEPKILLKAR
jgi:LPS O-antigen subunit length determinant protein (WzzB/FepE family)